MAADPAGSTSKMEGDPDAEVAAQVPFYDLCCLLEKIADTSGTEKKKKILSTFISSWREAHRKLHRDASKTVSGVIISTQPHTFTCTFSNSIHAFCQRMRNSAWV